MALNAVALLLFAIVPVTLGMVARVHHPGLPSADLALPVLLGSDLPPLVGALTLASVFAAEVSAADAVLFMLSTSLSQDLYRRFMAPEAEDAQLVQVARWSAGVAAAAGLGMALVLPTVVDALKIFYSVLTVALFVPVVGGLLWARPTSVEALSSMAVGLSAMLVTYLVSGGQGVAGVPPVVAGLVGASVGFGGARCDAGRAVIAARHLSRTFGDRSAVEDVTFDVKAGEIFGLLGPNGAGKTTTLRMIAGLIAPTSGEASVAGVPLTSRTIDRVRQHVGFLTEAPGLWERLSVRTNLLTYARLHQVKDPAATVNSALERFGLADRAESMAVELSKGLKQRVALARTLLHNPPVVLLDEPTSGLDPHSARLVRDMVLELRKRGHAVIISTHNLDEAERVADRVGVLRRRFLAVATPGELRHRLFGSRVRITMAGDAARVRQRRGRCGRRRRGNRQRQRADFRPARHRRGHAGRSCARSCSPGAPILSVRTRRSPARRGVPRARRATIPPGSARHDRAGADPRAAA